MRMRQHVHVGGCCRRLQYRACMVHEDERAYHTTEAEGEDAFYVEAGADGSFAGFDDDVEHGKGL
jgi:hypothetical protein